MNQHAPAQLKRWRATRASRNAALCATRSPNPIRFREPRPRTILVQFVAHAPEALPVRVMSFR
jgi:hypothetical protein